MFGEVVHYTCISGISCQLNVIATNVSIHRFADCIAASAFFSAYCKFIRIKRNTDFPLPEMFECSLWYSGSFLLNVISISTIDEDIDFFLIW